MGKIRIDVEVLEMLCDCAKDLPRLPRKKKKQCKKIVERRLHTLMEWWTSKRSQEHLLIEMMQLDESIGMYEKSNEHKER